MSSTQRNYGYTICLAAIACSGCLSDPSDPAQDLGSSELSSDSTVVPSTGQSLSIEILRPADGIKVLPGNVQVDGRVAIGGGSAGAYNILTVIDVSGSTASPSRLDCDGSGAVTAADDFNRDGSIGDVLDCEIAGALALNDYLHGSAGIDVGMIPFGNSAAIADLSQATGAQPFTSPADADRNTNGSVDFDEVARSLTRGFVRQFTLASVGTGTSFNAAMTSMTNAFASQPTGERNVALFFSDGQATITAANISAASARGITVYTFAVGAGTAGCAVGAPLRQIADGTGGVCTEVRNPADLPPVIRSIRTAGIAGVTVNGAPVTSDLLGNFTHPLQCVAGQTLDIVAVATASDADATTATANIRVECCADANLNGVCDSDEGCGAAPVVECNAADFNSLPAQFVPTVSSTCPTTVDIPSYQCFSIAPGGRVRNVTSTCSVSTADGRLTVNNPGGVVGYVTWTVRGTDSSGTSTSSGCRANYDLR